MDFTGDLGIINREFLDMQRGINAVSHKGFGWSVRQRIRNAPCQHVFNFENFPLSPRNLIWLSARKSSNSAFSCPSGRAHFLILLG